MILKPPIPLLYDDLINGYYGRGDLPAVTNLDELFGSYYGSAPKLDDEFLTSSYGKSTTEDIEANGRRSTTLSLSSDDGQILLQRSVDGSFQEYVVGDPGGPQFEEYVVASEAPAK